MYRLTNDVSASPHSKTISRHGAVRWPILAAVVAGTLALGGTALSLMDFGQASSADSALSSAQKSSAMASAKVTPTSASGAKSTDATAHPVPGTASGAAGSQQTPLQRAQANSDQKMAKLISGLEQGLQQVPPAPGQSQVAGASNEPGRPKVASAGNESGGQLGASTDGAASAHAADGSNVATGAVVSAPRLTSEGRPIPVNNRPLLRRPTARPPSPHNSPDATQGRDGNQRLPQGSG